MIVRQLSKVDHKRVLRDVFLEHRVVAALEAPKKKKDNSRRFVVIAFVVRLVKPFFLNNIVLIISAVNASPEARSLLLPTIAVQYGIRILQAMFVQLHDKLPPAVDSVPKVIDCLQKDVFPIAEEVARFLNLPGVADGIEGASHYLSKLDKTGQKIEAVAPMVRDLAQFLNKPVVVKSASKAVRRLSTPDGPVLVVADSKEPAVGTVADQIAQLLNNKAVSANIQAIAQDARSGAAIDASRDVQPLLEGLLQLLRHPNVVSEIQAATATAAIDRSTMP